MEVFLEVQQIEDICTDFIDPRKDRQGQPMFWSVIDEFRK